MVYPKTSPKPPRLAVRLLKRFFPDETGLYTQLGDIDEAFKAAAKDKSNFAAKTWYWMTVLRSIPYSLWQSVTWNSFMIKSYLKIALRNLQRNKIQSLINIVGLSIGLAFCILIYLFISDEFSFDKFHEKADSIYGIVTNDHFYKRSHRHGPVPMARILKENFPEIENFSRLVSQRNVPVKYKESIFNETVTIVDPQFLEILSFPLIKGNPTGALISDSSVVLTQQAADKYFGDENPMGKILLFTFVDRQKPYVVNAIAKNIPSNSSINFSFLINMNNLDSMTSSNSEDDWRTSRSQSYLLLKEHTEVNDIANRILPIVKPHLSAVYEIRNKYGSLVENGETITYSLQNLKDFHLNSSDIYGLPRSDIKKSYILAVIALLILCIAVINFINMTVGRASERACEIGVRKMLGAGRKHLIRQFWIESICTASISIFLGLFMAILMLPVFNSLAKKNLVIHSFYHFHSISFFLLIMVLIAVTAGSFPSLVMPHFKVTDILRGKFKLRRKNLFTKSLIVLQFSISVFLLVASMVMTKQIRFMKNYNLGFDKDGILIVDLQETDTKKSQKLLKLFNENIKNHSAVLNVSGCMNSPNRTDLYGMIKQEERNIYVWYNRVTFDYLKTMNMSLIEGRDFEIDFSSNSSAVIVNNKLVEELGLDQPIGKTFKMGPEPPVTIIGVVKNFNYSSLEEEVGPAALNMDPESGLFYSVIRVSSDNIKDTIDHLGNKWKEIQPLRPFKYSFLDDDIQLFYGDENRWNSIVDYSSFFTVLIACMGIFGLTLITVNNRVKEIGIRKILGASVLNILKLITSEFVLLVLASNIIAWPLAWIVMNKWLQNYAYRVNFGFLPLLIPGILTAVVSLLTSGGYSVRAATANPADSLRYE